MRTKTLSPTKHKKTTDSSRPEVIIDFIFDEGMFFITIKNIGDKPALKVRTKFNTKIFGIDGAKEISALPLFQKIEFLAPQKEIVTLLDNSASYFGRDEPTKITAKISYQSSKRKKYSATIKHDLTIYKDIVYIQPRR